MIGKQGRVTRGGRGVEREPARSQPLGAKSSGGLQAKGAVQARAIARSPLSRGPQSLLDRRQWLPQQGRGCARLSRVRRVPARSVPSTARSRPGASSRSTDFSCRVADRFCVPNNRAQLRDHSDHFTQAGLLLERGTSFAHHHHRLPFAFIEDQVTRQLGALTAQPHDIEQSPGDNHKEHDGGLEAQVVPQLHLLETTAAFEDFVEEFDFPAARARG